MSVSDQYLIHRLVSAIAHVEYPPAETRASVSVECVTVLTTAEIKRVHDTKADFVGQPVKEPWRQ